MIVEDSVYLLFVLGCRLNKCLAVVHRNILRIFEMENQKQFLFLLNIHLFNLKYKPSMLSLSILIYSYNLIEIIRSSIQRVNRKIPRNKPARKVLFA